MKRQVVMMGLGVVVGVLLCMGSATAAPMFSSWEFKADMTTAQAGPASATVDGKIYNDPHEG